MPKIFLPLETVDKCHACGKVGDLRLCSQCAERAYCSAACQKKDWKSHKPTCKTDRIDLTSFYPVLACVAESSHAGPSEVHPALRHKVINSPNPDTPACPLPDGSAARIVHLGPPIQPNEWREDLGNWWPNAESPSVRAKLMRRIAREGNVLAVVTSTCLALMLAIYMTTTTSGRDSHRVRLRYRSSPVSDFGIVAGSARVTPEDRLAYILPDKSLMKGQSPDNHYWIYFRTQKGEEVVLDCSMFTFNMCLVVQTRPYLTDALLKGFASVVPAWFKDRKTTRGLAALASRPLLTERSRFSVLRDEGIQKALEKVDVKANGDLALSDDAVSTFTAFMAKVAGCTATASERECLIRSLVGGVNIILDTAVRTDRWKRFPVEPTVGVEADPGEVID